MGEYYVILEEKFGICIEHNTLSVFQEHCKLFSNMYSKHIQTWKNKR